jgi:glycerophosphoryl diester phosphodiesterase
VLQKNESWVSDAKRRKLTVNVWTVNEQALAESYINQGVDFITTDEPEMLLKLIGKKK